MTTFNYQGFLFILLLGKKTPDYVYYWCLFQEFFDHNLLCLPLDDLINKYTIIPPQTKCLAPDIAQN